MNNANQSKELISNAIKVKSKEQEHRDLLSRKSP